MKACRRWRDHLIEAVAGELTAAKRADLDRHLATCPRCSAQLAGFEATAERFAAALPNPRSAGGIDTWRHIAPEIEAIDRRRRTTRRGGPGLGGLRLDYPAAASSAAGLLLLGLALGFLVRAPDGSPKPSPVGAQQVEVELGFARFLERSTPLLLAIANRRVGGAELASFDPAAERLLADRLAVEAADLAAELDEQGLRRQADLLSDLEVVFLQLANLPEQQYSNGLAMVQATLESRALLFQLSVEEMRRL